MFTFICRSMPEVQIYVSQCRYIADYRLSNREILYLYLVCFFTAVASAFIGPSVSPASCSTFVLLQLALVT